MGEALLWGVVAGSSLVIGGALSIALRPSKRAVGLLMAFGSGVLISAVAYELVGEAFETSGGSGWVAAGLGVGALSFYVGDLAIERRGGGARKTLDATHEASQQKAIVLGTVLDGVPEGVVLGMSLIGGGGGSVAVIAAVFLSNLPEAIGATPGLSRGGMSNRRLLGMWVAIMALTAIAAAVGFAVFDTASSGAVAFVMAYAGGALLTMVADTMMPEAFKQAGRASGLMTVLGFALAFALAQLG